MSYLMINTIYITLLYPKRYTEPNPLYITGVRQLQSHSHRAIDYTNKTDRSYIMRNYLSELYLTPAKVFSLYSLLLSCRRIIPSFIRPIIYNAKEISAKNIIKRTMYIKNYILKNKTKVNQNEK